MAFAMTMLNRIANMKIRPPPLPGTRRPPGGREAGAEVWRQVPKINLLVKPRRKVSRIIWVRAGLGLVALLIFYQAWGGVQDWRAANDRVTGAKIRLDTARRELSAEQAAVEEVKQQIAALKEGQEASRKPLAAVQAARVDWHLALSTLYGISVPGIQINSVNTSKEGGMKVQGAGADVLAIEVYQRELRARSQILALQTLTWRVQEGAAGGQTRRNVEFTAELRVVAPQ